MNARRTLVYLGLVYVVVVWSFNTIFVKHAIAHFDPLAFTGLRFLTMTPLAFLLARVLGERVRVERRDLPLLIACGVCGYGAYQYLWIFGLAHTTAFASALLAALAPVFTLAIVALKGTEHVNARRWAGAALALFGVAVFEGVFAAHLTFAAGDGLTLISAISFAMFNVLVANLLDRYTPVALAAITMTVGAIAIVPGAMPRILTQNWHAIGPLDWAALAFAITFPILLTYPVWNYGISQIGAGRTSLFQFGAPVLTGLFSVPILHNRIEPHQIVGGAVCIAGMAISQVRKASGESARKRAA